MHSRRTAAFRAAKWGLIAGMVYALARIGIDGEMDLVQTTRWPVWGGFITGHILGGAAGGAVLFAFIGWIANWPKR